MRIFLRALALWFATVTFAAAGWQVVSSESRNPPNELVEHRQTELKNDASGDQATLHLAIFRSGAATLRVIDQPDTPRGDLAEVMKREHALAGVNGGYFDPQDRPVGLLISGGKQVAPLSSARLLSGVLFTRNGRVEIVRTKYFEKKSRIENAVQCGPLLVEKKRPVAGLNDTRAARRTFALVDGKGGAALGFCSGVSLAQLADILATPNVAGERTVARALNLDGGSSSAFWFGGNEEPFSISEQKTVRDFVAVVPRATR